MAFLNLFKKENLHAKAISEFNQGIAFSEVGNYLAAIDKLLDCLTLLEKAKIKIEQKNELIANVLSVISRIRGKMGQYELAEQDLSRALAYHPNDAGIYFSLGSLKLDQHQFEDAIPFFIRMIDIDPSNPDGYYFLGVCKMELKRYDDAISNYEEALAIEMKLGNNEDIAHTLIGLGQSNYGLEKLANALTYYDRAISFDDKNSAAFVLRGNCKIDMGDKKGGCEDYHRALELGDSLVQQNIDEYCK